VAPIGVQRCVMKDVKSACWIESNATVSKEQLI
jgi:hypothetical protein